MDEIEETISVNVEGGPKKKKLNTLLGGKDKEDEEQGSQEDDRNSEDFGKIDIRVNAHKKFDIKQLKQEIWKII